MSSFWEPVVSILLKQVLKTAKSSLFQELRPELLKIEARLLTIHTMVEQQRAMWLKSGLSFIQLGQYGSALEDLVRAVASDDKSAVANFVLSALLARDGRNDAAKHYFTEAWMINPFCVLRFLSAPELSVTSVDGPPSIAWRLSVKTDKSIKATLPKQKWWGKLIPDEDGALSAVACSGGKLVACWDKIHQVSPIASIVVPFLGSMAVPFPGARVVSLIDLDRGVCTWSRLVKRKMKLLLATPRYLLMRDEDNLISCLLADSGADSGEMSPEYLETIFCPFFDLVLSSGEYAASHKVFTLSLDQFSKKLASQRLLHSGTKIEESEEVGIVDPTRSSHDRIGARNSWTWEPPTSGRLSREKFSCCAKVWAIMPLLAPGG